MVDQLTSTLVRMDGDSLPIAVSTKGIVTCEIKPYGDLLDKSQYSAKFKVGTELYEEFGAILKASWQKINPEG